MSTGELRAFMVLVRVAEELNMLIPKDDYDVDMLLERVLNSIRGMKAMIR